MDLEIVLGMDTLNIWSVDLEPSALSSISKSTRFCDDR
jgi:hypothetical protein